MKCFSLYFTILFSTIIFAQTETIKLIPTSSAELFNGDKTTIQIVTDLTDDDLASFVGKNIAEKFYVIKFIKESNKRYFSIFVLNPSAPKKKQKDIKVGPEFILADGFKISFDQNRMEKDFFLMHTEYEPEIEKSYLKEFVGLIIFLLALFFSYWKIYLPYRNKQKLKRQKMEKAETLIERLDNVQSRKDFESIYAIKRELDSYLEVDKKVFKKFLNQLNEIQYKKSWSEQELADLKAIYKNLGDIRIKDGI